ACERVVPRTFVRVSRSPQGVGDLVPGFELSQVAEPVPPDRDHSCRHCGHNRPPSPTSACTFSVARFAASCGCRKGSDWPGLTRQLGWRTFKVVPEMDVPRSPTNREVYDTIMAYMEAVKQKYYRRHIDTSVFERIGPFVDWNALRAS